MKTCKIGDCTQSVFVDVVELMPEAPSAIEDFRSGGHRTTRGDSGVAACHVRRTVGQNFVELLFPVGTEDRENFGEQVEERLTGRLSP